MKLCLKNTLYFFCRNWVIILIFASYIIILLCHKFDIFMTYDL